MAPAGSKKGGSRGKKAPRSAVKEPANELSLDAAIQQRDDAKTNLAAFLARNGNPRTRAMQEIQANCEADIQKWEAIVEQLSVQAQGSEDAMPVDDVPLVQDEHIPVIPPAVSNYYDGGSQQNQTSGYETPFGGHGDTARQGAVQLSPSSPEQKMPSGGELQPGETWGTGSAQGAYDTFTTSPPDPQLTLTPESIVYMHHGYDEQLPRFNAQWAEGCFLVPEMLRPRIHELISQNLVLENQAMQLMDCENENSSNVTHDSSTYSVRFEDIFIRRQAAEGHLHQLAWNIMQISSTPPAPEMIPPPSNVFDFSLGPSPSIRNQQGPKDHVDGDANKHPTVTSESKMLNDKVVSDPNHVKQSGEQSISEHPETSSDNSDMSVSDTEAPKQSFGCPAVTEPAFPLRFETPDLAAPSAIQPVATDQQHSIPEFEVGTETEALKELKKRLRRSKAQLATRLMYLEEDPDNKEMRLSADNAKLTISSLVEQISHLREVIRAAPKQTAKPQKKQKKGKAKAGPDDSDDEDDATESAKRKARLSRRKTVVDDTYAPEEIFSDRKYEYPKSVVIPYLELSETEQQKYEAEAYEAIELYRKDNTKLINFDVRRVIRQVDYFMPHAAQISYDLALHIHTNSSGNLQCRYHEKTRHYERYDGRKDCPYIVYGTSYQVRLNKTPADNIHPAAGFMHCGCPIDEVLMDFYFTKTWTARSRRLDYRDRIESLGPDVLNPRHRTFVVQAITKLTGLSIDNIYCESWGTESDDHRVKLLNAQAGHIMRQLQALGMAPHTEASS